jgi:hypothetical protein
MDVQMRLLDVAHRKLGWPAREAVLEPSGAGPGFYARLVKAKLGRPLARRNDVAGVEVGVLAADPHADATEPPIAVVCEFAGIASAAAIEEAHRLAWNLCRSPLLVTLEPHQIRAWSCCEPPSRDIRGELPKSEIHELRIDPGQQVDFSTEAARALSWVSLASGQLFRDFAPRFRREQCADSTLLDNLRAVRNKLHKDALPLDIVHDLLARLIFVQFLFHRKDDDGRAALTPAWLARQHELGLLTRAHNSLESVLRSHKDIYALFRMLNDRFNGDLFPGKAESLQQREAEWRAEMDQVSSRHLSDLADFVGGKMVIRSGQRSLWPLYSFDVIPLEFISSIYEAFVSKDKGTHYTPSHLVDIVLDTCLPWDDDQWDIKVLDPACGSGIFLVKAFQRLVYRWRRSQNFKERPTADVLRKLLGENLFGIDIKRDAVRVACFSLYLAMCDEIEPRYIWDRVKFPLLRGRRLIASDFFREDGEGFRTLPDQRKYDVVVGNAPWGTGTMTEQARKWAKSYNWGTSYKNIGPLFLAKGAWLVKPDGRVAMLQPSGLLFNTIKTASDFRKRLLSKYAVEQIINLSALRFGLFKDAVAPACIICLRPSPPDYSPITYISPKPSLSADDNFRIIFDAYDHHAVLSHEAHDDPGIWTTLMWGGRRDHALLRRLSGYPTLLKLKAKGSVVTRTGIIRGSKPTKRQDAIVGRPILDQEDFPTAEFPYLNPAHLPINENPMIHWKDSTNWSAFQAPQLLIKLGWRRSSRRFQARIVRPEADGVLCSTSYVSAHVPPARRAELDSACAVYNSKVAAYYLLHSSSRFASFIQEVNANDLLSVPLPRSPVDLTGVASPADSDEAVRLAFGFKVAEWTLIEDAFTYSLSAFQAADPLRRRGGLPNARSAADPPISVTRDMLKEYGDTFARVIRAGFGDDKRVRTTVFRTPVDLQSPVHLVAVHLGWPGIEGVSFEDITAEALLSRILRLSLALEQRSPEGATIRRRVARVYDSVPVGRQQIPTVYLCKPSLPRYWTRSMAMRDADDVAADLLTFSNSRPGVPGRALA